MLGNRFMLAAQYLVSDLARSSIQNNRHHERSIH
jgi:hypothetical protein